MQRGLVWIGGVAVICVAAFLYFGLNGSEPEEASEIAGARQSEAGDREAGDLASPAGEQTRASRVAAAREKRKAAREQSRQKAEAAAAEAAGTEAGSSRAAAERRRREGGTEAGGAREPRREALSDRAQIEALFRAAGEVPRQEAPERRDESASEMPGEGDPESEPGKESAGRASVMKCETDPWICNVFPMASQMPGTISVISDGMEAVYIAFGRGGEVWIRTPDGVVRLQTPALTTAGQVSKTVSNYFN